MQLITFFLRFLSCWNEHLSSKILSTNNIDLSYFMLLCLLSVAEQVTVWRLSFLLTEQKQMVDGLSLILLEWIYIDFNSQH